MKIKLLITLSILLSITSYAKPKLLVTGSSTIAPLMLEISKRYENKFKDIRIDIQTGGSSRGIADQRKQTSNIGMVSRALKPQETDLKSYLVARDGISLITHKSNPIKELTRKQIIEIYLGKTTNWSKVGGPNKTITVVHKAEGRSTLEVFLKYFNLKNSNVKPHIIIGDNEQGIKTVSGNPYAIGYVSIGTAEYNAKIGVPIKTLSLNGVKATVKNVSLGIYPLSRELNLIIKGKPDSNSKKLIQFALSNEVKDLVQQHYFVPINQ